jgi:hypothetical protein
MSFAIRFSDGRAGGPCTGREAAGAVRVYKKQSVTLAAKIHLEEPTRKSNLTMPFPVLFLALVPTINEVRSVSTSRRLLQSFLQNIALSSS